MTEPQSLADAIAARFGGGASRPATPAQHGEATPPTPSPDHQGLPDAASTDDVSVSGAALPQSSSDHGSNYAPDSGAASASTTPWSDYGHEPRDAGAADDVSVSGAALPESPSNYGSSHGWDSGAAPVSWPGDTRHAEAMEDPSVPAAPLTWSSSDDGPGHTDAPDNATASTAPLPWRTSDAPDSGIAPAASLAGSASDGPSHAAEAGDIGLVMSSGAHETGFSASQVADDAAVDGDVALTQAGGEVATSGIDVLVAGTEAAVPLQADADAATGDAVDLAARDEADPVSIVDSGVAVALGGGDSVAPLSDGGFATHEDVAGSASESGVAAGDRDELGVGDGGEAGFTAEGPVDDLVAEEDVVAVAGAENDGVDSAADGADSDAEVSGVSEADGSGEGVVVGGSASTDAEGGVVQAGTGHEAVDAAVRAVANAARLPVQEQLAAYEAAHETLREVLASIDE